MGRSRNRKKRLPRNGGSPKGRSDLEVRLAYAIQIAALRASCEAFDSGVEWEAIRLANPVSVIVHDGDGQSITTILGIKRKLQFLASGPEINGANVVAAYSLVTMETTNLGVKIKPILGEIPQCHRRLTFSKWWNDDLIYASGQYSLTRRQLVLTLRNQEGASHFDRLGDEGYIKLATDNGMFFGRFGEPPQKVFGIQLVLMRQVAWELLETLKDA